MTIQPNFRAAPERAQKGRRWMLALQRQVEATWLATLNHDSVLCQDHGLEVDIEPLGVELTFALIAVRVLDFEVFVRSHGEAYEAHRAACIEGRTVEGFTLIRNAEVHLPVVVDPMVERALSVPVPRARHAWPYQGQFRLFPAWREFDQLPPEVRATEGTANRCKASYRDHVGGKLILDTLLDAVRFFYECDPSLGAVSDDGGLLHFPLPAVLSVSGERRHPLTP
jgi:hypothetical protein